MVTALIGNVGGITNYQGFCILHISRPASWEMWTPILIFANLKKIRKLIPILISKKFKLYFLYLKFYCLNFQVQVIVFARKSRSDSQPEQIKHKTQFLHCCWKCSVYLLRLLWQQTTYEIQIRISSFIRTLQCRENRLQGKDRMCTQIQANGQVVWYGKCDQVGLFCMTHS